LKVLRGNFPVGLLAERGKPLHHQHENHDVIVQIQTANEAKNDPIQPFHQRKESKDAHSHESLPKE